MRVLLLLLVLGLGREIPGLFSIEPMLKILFIVFPLPGRRDA